VHVHSAAETIEKTGRNEWYASCNTRSTEMRRRTCEDTQPMAPMPRDNRRLRLRRELLRDLQITELKVVVGGGGVATALCEP